MFKYINKFLYLITGWHLYWLSYLSSTLCRGLLVLIHWWSSTWRAEVYLYSLVDLLSTWWAEMYLYTLIYLVLGGQRCSRSCFQNHVCFTNGISYLHSGFQKLPLQYYAAIVCGFLMQGPCTACCSMPFVPWFRVQWQALKPEHVWPQEAILAPLVVISGRHFTFLCRGPANRKCMFKQGLY